MAQGSFSTRKRTFTYLTGIEWRDCCLQSHGTFTLRNWGDLSTISRKIKRGGAGQQIDTNPLITCYSDAGARVYQRIRENCGAHSTVMKAWEFVRYAEERILQDK